MTSFPCPTSLLASIFTGPATAPNGMLYDLPLKPVGMALGAALILSHVLAFVFEKPLRKNLPSFPRSPIFGQILLSIAAVWTLLIVWRIDLGEMQPHRQKLMLAVPLMYVLALWQMREFLAVRALGMLFLLAAEPLLDAAFLRPEPTRLLLPTLAYCWITAGLFWVGMPWLLRDQISWLVKSAQNFRLAAGAGVAYGTAVLACALLFY